MNGEGMPVNCNGPEVASSSRIDVPKNHGGSDVRGTDLDEPAVKKARVVDVGDKESNDNHLGQVDEDENALEVEEDGGVEEEEDDDDDEEEEDHAVNGAESSGSGAGAASAAHRLDAEDVDLDSAEDSEDEHLLRRVLAAAVSQGIPLDYLANHFGVHLGEDDDNEDIVYPFERPPTFLADVARFIQSGACKRILVLAGAGMSVASGIPDFRSSNGLYATLDPRALTATEEQAERIEMDKSYCLDQHLFMENPLPCLEVNREFILGVQERRWKATLAHRLVELLRSHTTTRTEESRNGGGGDVDGTDAPSDPKLVRLYTQNIDGLEDQCEGLGHVRRIAVHGSMDEAECATCHATMDFDVFCDRVRRQIKDITGRDPTAPTESRPIVCPECANATVKPSIVLFRSRLPEVFFQSVPDDVQDIDLLLVLGTSLAVAPANSLVWRVPRSAMRVLINREPVGWHLGMDHEAHDRDFFAQGDCENVALDLMDELGWLEQLRPLLDRNELPDASAQLLKARLEEKMMKPNALCQDEQHHNQKATTKPNPSSEKDNRKPAAQEQET